MCMVTELLSVFIARVTYPDLLRNVNKITHLLLFVQNYKTTEPNWQ